MKNTENINKFYFESHKKRILFDNEEQFTVNNCIGEFYIDDQQDTPAFKFKLHIPILEITEVFIDSEDQNYLDFIGSSKDNEYIKYKYEFVDNEYILEVSVAGKDIPNIKSIQTNIKIFYRIEGLRDNKTFDIIDVVQQKIDILLCNQYRAYLRNVLFEVYTLENTMIADNLDYIKVQFSAKVRFPQVKIDSLALLLGKKSGLHPITDTVEYYYSDDVFGIQYLSISGKALLEYSEIEADRFHGCLVFSNQIIGSVEIKYTQDL